jgi:hypothetical protein
MASYAYLPKVPLQIVPNSFYLRNGADAVNQVVGDSFWIRLACYFKTSARFSKEVNNHYLSLIFDISGRKLYNGLEANLTLTFLPSIFEALEIQLPNKTVYRQGKRRELPAAILL